MANEFRKVTDQNGVDHPVCDDTRVDWSSYAISGAKNALHVPKSVFPASLNGLTFTESRNSGGELLSLTISGIASAETTLTIGELSTDKLGWILNGLDDGSSSTYEYFVRYHNSADGYLAEQDFHNGDNTLVCPSQHLADLAGITVKLRIKNDCDLTTPLVVKPMVRQASDTDPTFAPFAMTNGELTDAVTVKDGTVTSDFTVGTETMLSKVGKLVTCAIRINDITSATAWTTAICNIPQGFRPKGTGARMMTGYSNGAICLVSVSGYNGNVVPSVAVTNGAVIFAGSWVTD